MGLTPFDEYKMPAIAPKAHEVVELAEEIEQGSFESAKHMARKAIALALSALTRRSWFAIAVREDQGWPVFYGLFATEAAALKALEKNTLALVGEAGVVEIHGIGARSEHIAEVEGRLAYECATCGHQEVAHRWPRARVTGCVITRCSCRAYTRPRRALEEAQPA